VISLLSRKGKQYGAVEGEDIVVKKECEVKMSINDDSSRLQVARVMKKETRPAREGMKRKVGGTGW